MTDTTAETAQAQGAPNGEGAAGTQAAAKNGGDSDAKNTGLAGLKLAQLQALASQLGITGSSRMRKSALVEAISSHQRGGAVAERETAKKAESKTAKTTESKNAENTENKTTEGGASEGAEKKPRSARQKQEKDQGAAQGQGGEGKASRNGRSQRPDKGQASQDNSGDASASARSEQARPRSDQQEGSDQESQAQNSGDSEQQDGSQKGQNRHRRNRDRGRGEQGGQSQGDSGQQGGGSKGGRNDGGQNDSGQKGQSGKGRGNEGGRAGDRDGGGGHDGGRNDDRDGNRRNRRNRNRNDRNDRNNRRRGRGGPEVDETEVTEDDVLIPVAGILDVLDNYAFVRTSGYLSGQSDVYVSLAQVKRHNLRKGDAVTGHIRAPREDEKPNKRQKFNALVKLDAVNGRPSEANQDRVDFSKLVPLYPQERLRLEGDPKNVGPRVIDLVAPIGKGQRGLIVSPPKAGKTMILQSLANAIKTNNPEVHLMMVLVDERPEEVTDMQRTVDGEVIASTFDRPADDHTTVAELAIERAKRLVELGKDVVVLLDSMTRLGRAYNTAAPASGRILSGGVDANALYPPKRFFGAARNIENGGSLTILATALVETGSKMDEVIFEEFKGTGNMELRLSRRLADKRIFPAVNVNESSTRREENLLSPEEIKIMWKLRRVLSGLEQEQGLDLLLKKLKETQSNAEFLMVTQKTTLGDSGN